MKTVFLDSSTFDSAIKFDDIVRQVTDFNLYKTTHDKFIIERSKNADIIISNKVPLTANTLKQLPQLKLICIAATGTNNVDLATAKELGIAVTNVGGYAKHSVTQYIFANLLEIYSHTSHFIESTRNGHWQNSDTFCLIDKPIESLAGKTLGLIGYGAIAQQVEIVARAFGMRILVAERANSAIVRPNRLPFEDLLTQADIVSIHCPLTSATTNLFNVKTINMMKTGAILINTARGGIVENQALITALSSNKLAAAIIDVLEQEPPPKNHPLLTTKLNNLILTAHIAWGSIQAQQTLINTIATNIASFKQHGNENRVV